MTEEVKEEAVDEVSEAGAETPAPKKKKNKLVIIGVVVGVVVVLGVGLWVWHEQPSFCNAICHSPMDAYGATYLEGNVDKYGNELDETQAKAMMAFAHKTNDANATCMSCHTPVLSQQIDEAMKWVSGNYEVVGENSKGQVLLAEHSLDDMVVPMGLESGDQFCLKAGCHVNDDGSVMTRDDLLAKTADLHEKFNPHKAQHGEIACGECHKGHSQSVNYCSQCHAEAPVPEGWLTYSEAQKRAKAA